MLVAPGLCGVGMLAHNVPLNILEAEFSHLAQDALAVGPTFGLPIDGVAQVGHRYQDEQGAVATWGVRRINDRWVADVE